MSPEKASPDIRTFLLVALVGSAALLPPELNPSGLALAVVLAAGCGVLLLFPSGPHPVIPRGWLFPASIVAIYLLLAVLTSSQPHRSVSFLLGAGISFIAFAATFQVSGRREAREWILGSIAAAGSAVACWGIYQRVFGLADTARRLRALGQPELDPQILRAESGRAFGGFLLPSSLGIYLAMAIPITVRFGARCRWRGWRGFLISGMLLLQIAGLGASVSYGAVASLAVAALAVFMRVPWKRRGWILGSVAAAAAAAATAFLVLRAGEGASPLALRIGNWVAAWKVFLSAPFFGVGFGNLADAYPRVMTAGMNETAFVHNSYLQIAAEGGALALLWVVVAANHLVVRILPSASSREAGIAEMLVGISPLAFLVHNLADFSAYLPSLSITFAILAGAAAMPGSKHVAGEGGKAAWTALPRSALLLLLLGGAAWELRDAWSRQSLETGRDLAAAGRREEGNEILRRAAGRDPSNPDLPAILAEIDLPRRPDEDPARGEGERFARRAVEARPERAYGHYVLALYRLAAGDRGEAWSELARARELYPARELYAQEESRLRRMIAGGPATGMGTDAPR